MAQQQQILLIEDVEDLGRSGDIVRAKPGFIRNFLMPKGLAVIADKRALRMQERLQEERNKQAEVDLKEANELASRLEGKTFSVDVKVDDEGHMYGSVSAADVRHMVEKEFQVELLKKSVQLKHPIRKTGVHTVEIRLKEGVNCSITLKVIAEGVIEQVEAPKMPIADEAEAEA